jgi:hypothetical protein
MKFWAITDKDNHVIVTGNMVGITPEYVDNMAKEYNGTAIYANEPIKTYNAMIYDDNTPRYCGLAWDEIDAKQQKRN